MIVLRRILGLLLAGTAVWLLTILAGTLGATARLGDRRSRCSR